LARVHAQQRRQPSRPVKRICDDSAVVQRQRRAKLTANHGDQDRPWRALATAEGGESGERNAILGSARPERH
jgi:hypothetical protein